MREPVILVGGPLDGQRHMVPSPPPEAWNFREMDAEPMPSPEALQMAEAKYVAQYPYMREDWHAYGRKYHWFRWQHLPKEESVLELMQGYRRRPQKNPLSYEEVERIGHRLYQFGKDKNPVSRDCEFQALRIRLGWTGAGASIPPKKEKP